MHAFFFCACVVSKLIVGYELFYQLIRKCLCSFFPKPDSEIKTSLGYFVKDGATTMSRADVARYLLKVATEGFQKGAVVAISV